MKGKRKHSLRSLAAALACVLIAVQMIPAFAASRKYDGRIQYPCVLVHGLGGWGENAPQGDIPYFGATTGSLARYLRSEGYTVCVPSVGPYSSTWDRVCELYAQLTGTRTDYGAAHAKAHNHAQYGRTYKTALVPDWGQEINGQLRKINLVSHSFGGPTVNMLVSLLAYGDEAETAATGRATSPLFTGGKTDWVQSITTLCSPHNGAQLTCMVDDLGSVAGIEDTTSLLVDMIFQFVQTIDQKYGTPDLMLDQFGIGTPRNQSEVEVSLKKVESAENDHAFYDLSPDGAAELNHKIRVVDSVYYFSYAFCTTKAAARLQSRVPDTDTPMYLYPLALAIGAYTGTSAGGITIDKTWQDNDGLVSVVSAQYPFGKPHAAFPTGDADLQPGVWYVMPTVRGNHATAVGGLADPKATHNFFDVILQRTVDLPR